MKIGLLIIDEDPRDALRVAIAADKAGVDSIWAIDFYNRSSITRMASFATATEQATLGTSVTPLFARSPLALACAVRDTQALAGGRFILGVGSSTRRMNQDWYGFEMDHPAPRVTERVKLIQSLIQHQTGPFKFEGRFDSLNMAHFENASDPVARVPFLGAAVGDHMVRAMARCTDGIVGHTIASAPKLALLRGNALAARENLASTGGEFIISSQVIASIDRNAVEARRKAAQQVGFYSTVKSYDALFDGQQHDEARRGAREAFARGDIAEVAKAAETLVDERAVFGSSEDVANQLQRYSEALDLALLYTPHYGVSPEDVTRNELALIEVAAAYVDR